MRKRYLLLLITAFVGLVFLAVDRYTRDITQQEVDQTVKEADYYGDILFSRRYDDTGKLADTFYAASSSHYPDGDLTVFTSPRVLVSTSEDWVLTAKEGVLKGQSDTLRLSGDILIRPADGSDNMRLETSVMDYHIDAGIAETDALVVMTGQNSRMSGTGMLFDTARQRLELKSGVKTTYAPVD